MEQSGGRCPRPGQAEHLHRRERCSRRSLCCLPSHTPRIPVVSSPPSSAASITSSTSHYHAPIQPSELPTELPTAPPATMCTTTPCARTPCGHTSIDNNACASSLQAGLVHKPVYHFPSAADKRTNGDINTIYRCSNRRNQSNEVLEDAGPCPSCSGSPGASSSATLGTATPATSDSGGVTRCLECADWWESLYQRSSHPGELQGADDWQVYGRRQYFWKASKEAGRRQLRSFDRWWLDCR